MCQIDCTVASLCCRLMDRVFGPNWAVQLPFSVPTWLRKAGNVKGSKGIDWGWFSLNTMSSVILTDFVLSSYLMDQSWERMLSRSPHPHHSMSYYVMSYYMMIIIDIVVHFFISIFLEVSMSNSSSIYLSSLILFFLFPSFVLL